MNCVLIDNDNESIQLVEEYVLSIPFLKLLKSFENPVEALSFVYLNKVDLMLLHIDGQSISSAKYANLFQGKTPTIFIADSSKYAIEGFELNAIDFLVTPISFERFLKSISKAMELKLLKERIVNSAGKNFSVETDKPLFIKSGTKIHKINPSNILFLAKDGNYFNIHLTNDRRLLIRMNFFDVFHYIPNNEFIRIHKSYIINVKHIDTIEGQNIVIHNHKLPVGASYKQELVNYMKILQ